MLKFTNSITALLFLGFAAAPAPLLASDMEEEFSDESLEQVQSEPQIFEHESVENEGMELSEEANHDGLQAHEEEDSSVSHEELNEENHNDAMPEEELETEHDGFQAHEEDAGNHEMGEVESEEAHHDGFQAHEELEPEGEFIAEELESEGAF